MKHLKLRPTQAFFKVLAASRSTQAALMLLRPGQSTGAPDNEHPRSEQWLFVLSGSGVANVQKRRVPLRKHSLLLIEKDEIHQIRNTGRTALVTLNLYVPPAYTRAGELRSARPNSAGARRTSE